MAEATQRALVASLDWADLFKSWQLFRIKGRADFMHCLCLQTRLGQEQLACSCSAGWLACTHAGVCQRANIEAASQLAAKVDQTDPTLDAEPNLLD